MFMENLSENCLWLFPWAVLLYQLTIALCVCQTWLVYGHTKCIKAKDKNRTDCLCFGENLQTVDDWLKLSPPHHSHRSNTERWSQNTLKVVTTSMYYVFSGSIASPFILIIQWRRQLHLTWSATHDVVSREINLWKSFHLGSNLWPLTPHQVPGA